MIFTLFRNRALAFAHILAKWNSDSKGVIPGVLPGKISGQKAAKIAESGLSVFRMGQDSPVRIRKMGLRVVAFRRAAVVRLSSLWPR